MSDTFFDSAWYFLRYPSVDVPDRPWDAERTALAAGRPVRRWARARHPPPPVRPVRLLALHDRGLIPFAEPFLRLRLHGVLTMGGAKMSKSRGNVINPDKLLADHGADVSLGLLFTRPWDADGDFDPAVLVGVERFRPGCGG